MVGIIVVTRAAVFDRSVAPPPGPFTSTWADNRPNVWRFNLTAARLKCTAELRVPASPKPRQRPLQIG